MHVLKISEDSLAIDSGVVLPGINDGYAGVAPDAGAFEYGKAIMPISKPAPYPIPGSAIVTPTHEPTMTPVPTPTPTPNPIPNPLIKVKVSGKDIKFSKSPIKVSGVILAQASTFAKALGATSKYDSKKHSITITKGKTKILFTIGSKKAKIGSKSYVLSAALKLSVVPFVPVKFIAERFGYKYSFNSVTGVITIKK
jgi:hypothetical protein